MHKIQPCTFPMAEEMPANVMISYTILEIMDHTADFLQIDRHGKLYSDFHAQLPTGIYLAEVESEIAFIFWINYGNKNSLGYCCLKTDIYDMEIAAKWYTDHAMFSGKENEEFSYFPFRAYYSEN